MTAQAAEAVGAPGGDIDWSPPWRREPLVEAIESRTGIDVMRPRGDRDALADEMRAKRLALPEQDTWHELVDELLSKHVEPELVQPTVIVDYPVELSPFAKA